MILQLRNFSFLLSLVIFFISCGDDNSKVEFTEKPVLNKIEREPVNPYAGIDKSPLDISYYPPNFPMEKMNGESAVEPLVARVIYSRPQKKGRIIFADTTVNRNYIQHYGKQWRLGANEATEIEFFKPVIIGENKIAAGKYIIYCIPYPDKWVIKLNTNLYTWGLHINSQKDIMQIALPVSTTKNNLEYFTMVFQHAGKGADLVMAWGNMEVRMPVLF